MIEDYNFIKKRIKSEKIKLTPYQESILNKIKEDNSKFSIAFLQEIWDKNFAVSQQSEKINNPQDERASRKDENTHASQSKSNKRDMGNPVDLK